MKEKKLFVRQTPFLCKVKPVQGEVIDRFGDRWYKISNFDQMSPFLMNIVSDSDIWMFISSYGALTAGRRNPDNALFPYYTDDRLHDSQDITGSKTILWIQQGSRAFLWEPFSAKYDGIYHTQRNIYKNMLGNKLIFEEINHDLNLSFHYAWMNSDALGLIKKSWLTNLDTSLVRIKVLDGLLNILPPGISRRFQNEFSNLADAYKKNELIKGTTLALFTMSSLPTDKAEPNEALKANTVWSTGLGKAEILLSSAQLANFRCKGNVQTEWETKGERGAYFVCSELELTGNKSKEWCFVAELNQDHASVSRLLQRLRNEKELLPLVEKEVEKSWQRLQQLVNAADGFQATSSPANDFRHCSNTMFNIMRGGIPANGYLINTYDFRQYLKRTFKPVAERYESKLKHLPQFIPYQQLKQLGDEADCDFAKLCLEYLPLTFGRRHGDPSRPWNSFSIEIRDNQGNPIYNYQGNWRDIFQNWEALAISYPLFIENMIAKFVNASSADGYNPYRVTKDGFEWEELNPEDEWANIGYWGDHQIIYLLKLLEMSAKYHPGELQNWLQKPLFTYAHIPYKIKPYEELIHDPHNTIDFDEELNEALTQRVKELGSSAKLVTDSNGDIYYVNLAEKLLVPLLVKLSNFIPEAGIWMNTQRPEWNDANNALVGFGASMVTLYYLRRYLTFCLELFKSVTEEQFEFSAIVAKLFNRILDTLTANKQLLKSSLTEQQRKALLDQLGQAGSEHRWAFYRNGFDGQRKTISANRIMELMKVALDYVDHSIRANKREDGLYHAYNLIRFTESNGIAIRHMYEMLEGQVAILSSGYLRAEEAISLLHTLRHSALYREDQHSYILYPNRRLPDFLEKNNVPAELVKKSRLLNTLLAKGDLRIINQDVNGKYHFHSDMANARILAEALEELRPEYPELVEEEKQLILDIYEAVFDHQSFTGRSGTFYKYEGLGSIYWHMVSKLLLAVNENFYWAYDSDAEQKTLDELRSIYYDIRKGIGVHKSPKVYGAFPTDAYSHTPLNSGAQQPGMTGQVKEDILSRFAELGIQISNGKIHFKPALLKDNDFLQKQSEFEYFDLEGQKQKLTLSSGMLAFTLCQIPIIYFKGNSRQVVVYWENGKEERFNDYQLSDTVSAHIFDRTKQIKKIEVEIVA